MSSEKTKGGWIYNEREDVEMMDNTFSDMKSVVGSHGNTHCLRGSNPKAS
jgi:hypothetical protein